jgi:dihydroorotase
MNILLRKVTIADPSSSHNTTVKDILIEDGIIKKIDDNITAEAAQAVDLENCYASAGWVDIFSNFCDPGYEYKETLETGAEAAAAGGFTDVFVIPNTQPLIHNKTQVEYIVQKSKSLPVNIHPLGTVTKNGEGKELAEMYDMKNSGAIAFSDGLTAVQSPGLMLKALQYIKAFDGVIMQLPLDKTIGQHGLMNEGITSTRMGLAGIPDIAEELIIKRDIELLKYTNSKLHITGVSTAEGIRLIQKAKQEGFAITCSVTPYHLFFNDEDLQSYDTNLKVSPPLRSKKDMMALREAVYEGWVDCIASHHLPQDWDNKTVEFEYAKMGMISLQTSYAVIQTILPDLNTTAVTNLFSANARKIFCIENMPLTEGAVAEITLFDPSEETILTEQTNKSKSSNSPFLDKALKGKVIGIINKGQLFLNK